MGSNSRHEKKVGWEDLQAMGDSRYPPYKRKGGGWRWHQQHCRRGIAGKQWGSNQGSSSWQQGGGRQGMRGEVQLLGWGQAAYRVSNETAQIVKTAVNTAKKAMRQQQQEIKPGIGHRDTH